MLNRRSDVKAGSKYFSVFEELCVVAKRFVGLSGAKSAVLQMELPVSHKVITVTIKPETAPYDTGITSLVSEADENYFLDTCTQPYTAELTLNVGAEQVKKNIVLDCDLLTADDLRDENAKLRNAVRIANKAGQKQPCLYIDAAVGSGRNKFTATNEFFAFGFDVVPYNGIVVTGTAGDKVFASARCSNTLWASFVQKNVTKKVESIGYLVNPGVLSGEKVSLFSARDDGTDVVIVQEDNHTYDGSSVRFDERYFIRRSGVGKAAVVLAQSGLFLDGKPVNFTDYLRLLQAIALVEHLEIGYGESDLKFSDFGSVEGDAVYFDVELDATNHWRVSQRVTDFWSRYCYNNQRESIIMENYEATIDSLSIMSGKRRGYISEENGSTSCCALSLAYLLSSEDGNPRISSMLAVLPQLVRQKVVVVDANSTLEDGDLIGGGTFKDVAVELDGKVITGVERYSIPAANLEDGKLYLMKYVRPQTGRNHYGVVYQEGGKLFSLYDPWRKGQYYPRGHEITSLKLAKDTVFYRFTKDKES